MLSILDSLIGSRLFSLLSHRGTKYETGVDLQILAEMPPKNDGIGKAN
jgi:hypothetical protein